MPIRFNDLPPATDVTELDELAILSKEDDVVRKAPLSRILEYIDPTSPDLDPAYPGPVSDGIVSQFIHYGIGPIEPDIYHATYNYKKGDLFVYRNRLVVATEDIAAGDALHINSNLERTTLQKSIIYSIGPFTVPAGEQQYVVYDQKITNDSVVTTLYDQSTRPIAVSAGANESISEGALTITFGSPLPEDVIIFRVRITNG